MTGIVVAALGALAPLLLWWGARDPYRRLERALSLREKMSELPADTRAVWQRHLNQVMAEAMAARAADAIAARAYFHRKRTVPLVLRSLTALTVAVALWLVGDTIVQTGWRIGMQGLAVLAGLAYVRIVAVTVIDLQAQQRIAAQRNAHRGADEMRRELSDELAETADAVERAEADDLRQVELTATVADNGQFKALWERVRELQERQRSLTQTYGDLEKFSYGDLEGSSYGDLEDGQLPGPTRKRPFSGRVVFKPRSDGTWQVKKPPGDSKS